MLERAFVGCWLDHETNPCARILGVSACISFPYATKTALEAAICFRRLKVVVCSFFRKSIMSRASRASHHQ